MISAVHYLFHIIIIYVKLNREEVTLGSTVSIFGGAMVWDEHQDVVLLKQHSHNSIVGSMLCLSSLFKFV